MRVEFCTAPRRRPGAWRRGAAGVSLVLGLLLGALPAWPQDVPRSVDPGQIERRFEAPPAPKEEVAPLIPGIERELPPEEARGIRFVLSGLVVEGATAYPPESFAPLYEPLLAREVSLADIYAVAERITQRYQADGYLLSKAVVPAQQVELGLIRIRVLEGRLENIVFEGAISGSTDLLESYARKITQSQPLRADVLERYILLMNDLPGVRAERRLVPVPGAEGLYDLVIGVSHDTVYGFARADNRGSRFSGPYQLWLGGGLNSLFGGWDNTQLRAVTATQPRELQFADLLHSTAIGDDGTRVTFGVGASRSRPGHTLADDRIDSRGLFASVGIEHPVVRSRASDLFVGASLNLLESQREEAGAETVRDRVRALRLWARAGLVDGWGGRNSATIQLSRGLDVLGATGRGAPRASRAGAPAEFTKATFDVARYQELGPRWAVLAGVGGQRSGTKLFLSEQFGVGGELYGRAYDPAEIAGDDAIAGKIELQRTSELTDVWLRQHQVFAYYDYGRTWLRASPDDFDLASAGIGVRLLLAGGVFVSLEVAKPLTRAVDALGDDGNDPRLFFVLSASF